MKTPFLALACALVLAGCTSVPNRAVDDARGIDGVACVGAVGNPGAGFTEAANAALQARAQLPTGQGGVCLAKVFSITAPVTLYRVFDASKPYTRQGSWWSLARPAGSRADYRVANAICPEWSPLDRLAVCQIRPGSQVVLGTTQSATCADGTTLPKSAQIQVFVANDGRAGFIHTGACLEDTSWP